MSPIDAPGLLRPGLLEGLAIMVAGSGPVADAVEAGCTALGARVWACPLLTEGAPGLDEGASQEILEQALEESGAIDLLAIDCAGLFAAVAGRSAEREDGPGVERDAAREALGVCLQASWNITRAVASRAFLEDGRGGRIVYLAPAPEGEPSATVHLRSADAARAALENLSRTLSIEWARYGITTLSIALGSRTNAGETAALIAYLASPAGAYFSGCLLDLRGPAGVT